MTCAQKVTVLPGGMCAEHVQTRAMLIRFAAICTVACLCAMTGASAQSRAYAPGVVIAVFRDSIIGAPSLAVPAARLRELQARAASGTLNDADVPRYTNDADTNRALLGAGVVRVQRLFAAATFHVRAAYRLSIAGKTVQSAIAQLREAPGILSVTPDWYISPMVH
jgi:hypothetical protein